MQPLAEFVCDTCSELIASPDDGWLEWFRDSHGAATGFRIVHHLKASPLAAESAAGCYYDRERRASDMHLRHCLGADGLVHLLAVLESALADPAEVIEIIRRLQIPHYEEARLYWDRAEEDLYFEGSNEVWPYTQEALTGLIARYANLPSAGG